MVLFVVYSVKHLTTLVAGIMLVAVICLAGGSDERHRMGVHIRTTAATIHTAIAILTEFVHGIVAHTRRTGLQIHTFTAILQAVAAIITEIVCGHIITAGIAESAVICSRTFTAVNTHHTAVAEIVRITASAASVTDIFLEITLTAIL